MKVLVSCGYGAGWSTWISDLGIEEWNDPALIEAIEKYGNKSPEFQKALADFKERHPDAYLGGAEGLSVEEVSAGNLFRINEYDGAEGVEIFDKTQGWYQS